MVRSTDESTPLAAGSRRVADALLEQELRLRALRPRLAATRPVDVHDARVAARRLRSLLKTYRPLLDRRRSRLYRLDLKSFARALGPLREADVRSALLQDLAQELELPETERQHLAALVARDREAARRDFLARTATPGWQALEAALAAGPRSALLLENRKLQVREALELVRRPWRKTRRLVRQKPRRAAELHELRLALKHCRYAFESVADLAPRESVRLLRRLRRAQDVIGAHRDVMQAMEWIESRHTELGQTMSRQLGAGLKKRARQLRREAGERVARIAPAHLRWVDALRESPEVVRAASGRGAPGGGVSARATTAQSRSR